MRILGVKSLLALRQSMGILHLLVKHCTPRNSIYLGHDFVAEVQAPLQQAQICASAIWQRQLNLCLATGSWASPASLSEVRSDQDVPKHCQLDRDGPIMAARTGR